MSKNRIPIMIKVWGGEKQRICIIKKSLTSLIESNLSEDVEIILVDDANENKDIVNFLGYLKRVYRNVHVWRNKERLGPDKGQEVNFARLVEEYPDAKFYVNCDDDIIYHKEWLNRLIRIYEEAREIGLNGIFSAVNFPFRKSYKTIRLIFWFSTV